MGGKSDNDKKEFIAMKNVTDYLKYTEDKILVSFVSVNIASTYLYFCGVRPRVVDMQNPVTNIVIA